MIQLIQKYIESRRLAIASGYLPMPSSPCDLSILFELSTLPVFSGWASVQS